MKMLVESKTDGLLALVGKRVTFFTMNYIYTGDLIGVSARDAKLQNAGIVFETGPFSDKAWKDYQACPNPIFVRLNSVEAYTELK